MFRLRGRAQFVLFIDTDEYVFSDEFPTVGDAIESIEPGHELYSSYYIFDYV